MTTNSINNLNPNNFYVQKTASGTTVTETISQTSDTAGATARQLISVAGTSSANPCMKFNIIDTLSGFAVGPDNSSSDIFKVVIGSNVNPSNGSPVLTATQAGIIQQPTQPSFLAYLSADTGAVTGDGTAYIVICDTEVYDTNLDYASATGVFTAPVTGKYCFYTFAFAISAGSAGQDEGHVHILTSNLQYIGQRYNPINSVYSGAISFVGSYLADMDSGDTCVMRLNVGATGAKNVKVGGGTPDGFVQTYFCGNLEC